MRRFIALALLLAFNVSAETIGFTGPGDGNGNTGNEAIFASPLYTMPEDGTFTSVALFALDEGGGTGQAQIRVYDESGNTIATSAVGTGWSSGGSWVEMAISFSRTTGQQIRFAVMSTGAPLYVGRENDNPSQGWANGGPYTFGSWPTDPIGLDQDGDWILQANGTYTPAGSNTGIILKRRKH